ncbi:hypothetical protein [Flavobacterium sandaracinum]|uniref:Carboxypeptidase-like regulatory domain-containing protein n=1 Tax=Flavobacterium sandaracinum TaxID=2541733 RepID=A0A4R5CRN3_9FLAO|nr:hypothetical protein [Flavobacterium sandaracinum]TDE00385.1 hypothetical protein E0F91_16575 [Flavobacterium sandaracinum]
METINLKGQNVNKYLLYIVVVFSSNCMLCQKQIVGRYSSLMSNQEYYNYFDFNAKGTFEYHSGASLGDDEFGKGHYQIKKDSLFLNYNLTELEYKSYYKSKEYFNAKDLVTIKIAIRDLEGISNNNANIYIPNERNGYVQGKDGFVTFDLKKENQEVSIEISNLGYENYKLTLSKFKNHEIEVFLKKSSTISKAIKNEIKEYKILELTKNKIKLEQNGKLVELVKQLK